MAGIVGVDPNPLTLRELIWMADSKRRDAWSHTAATLSLIANVHRNPKKRSKTYTPAEFHPFVETRNTKVGVGVLKDLFVKKRAT